MFQELDVVGYWGGAAGARWAARIAGKRVGLLCVFKLQ